MGLSEQRLGERRSDHTLERHAKQAGKRAIGAPDASFVVHHRDALAQGVERRLPLLLGAAHHFEEPGVRDDDGGVGRQRREQPNVFGDKDPLTGVGDDERADHDAVRAQRDGGGGSGLEALRDHRGFGAGIPDQLEVLPRRGTGDQAGIVALDLLAAERCERPFGGGDLERVAGGFAHQRQERPTGIEKAHRVAHHLLDDAVQLQRIGQDVRQLLQREQLGQAAIELVRRAEPFPLGVQQPLPQPPQHEPCAPKNQGDGDARELEGVLSQRIHGHLYFNYPS